MCGETETGKWERKPTEEERKGRITGRGADGKAQCILEVLFSALDFNYRLQG